MADTEITGSSARLRARLAGALYVVCIVCGFFAELVVRAKLVVHSDAALSAHNIVAAPGLYRAGFFADVSAMTLGVLSSIVLYTLYKAVSRGLSNSSRRATSGVAAALVLARYWACSSGTSGW